MFPLFRKCHDSSILLQSLLSGEKKIKRKRANRQKSSCRHFSVTRHSEYKNFNILRCDVSGLEVSKNSDVRWTVNGALQENKP
jgi:hypothetical protein